VQVGANSDAGAEGATEEMLFNYNVSGIRLSEAAFLKLQQEISLTPWAAQSLAPSSKNSRNWLEDQREFFVGTVPLANGAFRKTVIRKSRIAQVDIRDFSLLNWTDRCYYEVCADPAVYAALPGEKSAAGFERH
jgi:hypothetical protein